MIYYTGDIHGQKMGIVNLSKKFELTQDDVIVILGDAGINYYGNEKDEDIKKSFAKLKPTIFCVHGNHEIRPQNLSGYLIKEWNNGLVWFEEKYPNILFAKDGEIFNIENIKHLVIGGAYSVDKFYRIKNGYGWWDDEQPSEVVKKHVEQKIRNEHFDIILSHTCPFKYEPREMFLPGIDQDTVDCSTEQWLDKIEEMADYKAWYCGHWHINKKIDKIHFLFNEFETSDDIKRVMENE